LCFKNYESKQNGGGKMLMWTIKGFLQIQRWPEAVHSEDGNLTDSIVSLFCTTIGFIYYYYFNRWARTDKTTTEQQERKIHRDIKKATTNQGN
jgi:hypothetical protein